MAQANQDLLEGVREALGDSDAEVRAGRPLTRTAILKIVGENMKVYDIPMNFTPGRS